MIYYATVGLFLFGVNGRLQDKMRQMNKKRPITIKVMGRLDLSKQGVFTPPNWAIRSTDGGWQR